MNFPHWGMNKVFSILSSTVFFMNEYIVCVELEGVVN